LLDLRRAKCRHRGNRSGRVNQIRAVRSSLNASTNPSLH
jgi:hypothetical protein